MTSWHFSEIYHGSWKSAMDVKLAIVHQVQFAMARKLNLQNKCKTWHLNEADRTILIMQMKILILNPTKLQSN